MDKPKIPTREQISAGGVAFRRAGATVEAALVAVAPSGRWQLPKGLVDAGETEEAAALREVREEAGVDCRPLAKIETVEYWYFATERGARVRYHKFVHFYLMEYVAGDVRDHDREVLAARWVEIGAAAAMLAFKSERETLSKAAAMIAERR